MKDNKKSSAAASKTRQIKVDYLARVEGEGGLLVKMHDGRVHELKLRIFEPPRLFEGFLRGRKFTEAPDITARICGICPVAYLMSSCQAMEQICGVTVGGQLRALRRLLYCGEWIESHALHMFFLHAPDFLGYEDAIQMAQKYPDAVKAALRVKKIGNHIMCVLGGREIHPINVRVGGFYSTPTRKALDELVGELEWALEAATDSLKWLATLDFPDFEQDCEYVALKHPDEYAIHEGRLVSDRGLDIAVDDFYGNIEEMHMPHSTSLHSRVKERGLYSVGPIARFNLNYDQLTPRALEAAKAIGLTAPCRNPFKSLLVRGVELILAIEESIRLIREYERPEEPSVPVTPRAGTGHGCTEAPRGALYHRYTINDEGIILDARIAPPTAQNQPIIEDDLRQWVNTHADDPQDKLTWECEQTIRNYDPCISCSTHYLKLQLER